MTHNSQADLIMTRTWSCGCPTTERPTGEGGQQDGHHQQCQGHADLQPEHCCAGAAVTVAVSVVSVTALVGLTADLDTGEDEKDAGADGGDDGHDEGGHHEALVPAPGPADGEAAGDHEEDRGPNAGGNRRGAMDYPHNVRDEDSQAAEDKKTAQERGGPGGVALPDALAGCGLDDVDDLGLGGGRLLLHHC